MSECPDLKPDIELFDVRIGTFLIKGISTTINSKKTTTLKTKKKSINDKKWIGISKRARASLASKS